MVPYEEGLWRYEQLTTAGGGTLGFIFCVLFSVVGVTSWWPHPQIKLCLNLKILLLPHISPSFRRRGLSCTERKRSRARDQCRRVLTYACQLFFPYVRATTLLNLAAVYIFRPHRGSGDESLGRWHVTPRQPIAHGK